MIDSFKEPVYDKFQYEDEPQLITIYTNAGNENQWSSWKPYTQGIAYTNDRGRTWTKYEKKVQENVDIGNRNAKAI